MLNVSERFQYVVSCPARDWRFRAEMTLLDGTRMELDGSDMIMNGINLSQAVMTTRTFHIGCACSAMLEIQLNNYTGKFTDLELEGAEIRLYIGLIVEQNYETGDVPEWICTGVYDIETANMMGSVIRLVGYDYLYRLSLPYKSTLRYPATLLQIVEDCCDHFGIVLRTRDFLNADYVVDERPTEEATTYRDLVAAAAQLAGCFARMTADGELEFRWYDMENPVMAIKNVGAARNVDITVTGVRLYNALNDEESYLCGEEGYVLNCADNPLAQNNLKEVCAKLGAKLNGFTFRPFCHEGPANPAIEAGDTAIVYDWDGREHPTILSRYYYCSDGNETFQADAPSKEARNRRIHEPSEKVEARVKANTIRKISAYDVQAKQFAGMVASTMGYYTTEEKRDDGSVIVYQHDTPKLEESRTIWKKNRDTLAVSSDGGKTWHGLDKDGNAVLNVLAAHGIVADWIKTGRLEGSKNSNVYFDLDKDELSASRLVSAKYPSCAATIGPSEVDKDSGAINVTVDDNNILSAYPVDVVGRPGVVWTAPALTNAARSNRKGIAMSESDIMLFADKDGIGRGVRINTDGRVEVKGSLSVDGELDMQNWSITNSPSLIPFDNVTSLSLKSNDRGAYLEIGNVGQYYGVDVWYSDARLKKEIKPCGISATDEIMKIPHRSFQMKENGAAIKCGYIAQEMQELNPDYVLGVEQHDDNGHVTDTVYQIRAQTILPLLSKAIQELVVQNQALERRVAALERGETPKLEATQTVAKEVPGTIRQLSRKKIKYPR